MAKKVDDAVIITNLDAILRECDEVGKVFDNISSRSHRLLVSTYVFSFGEGNVTPITYLMTKLGAAANRVAIGKWLANHGVIVGYSKAKKEWTAKLNKDKHAEMRAEYEADRPAFIAKLLAESYLKQDEAKSRDFEGFNLKAELAKLKAKVTKIKNDPTKANHPANDFTGMNIIDMALNAGKSTKAELVTVSEGATIN